jgi:hypothetical protein
MTALLLALALSAPPTETEWNGLNRAIDTAYQVAMAGNVTKDRPTKLKFGGNAPPPSRCITATVKLTAEEAKAFGLDAALTGPYLYGKMTACAQPNASEKPKHKWVVELAETVSDTFPDGTTVPAVTIALQGDADATFACACNPGVGTCNQTVDGVTGPAPLGVTLSPGTFSGAACQAKACVELAGASSWPNSCSLGQ